MLNKPSDIWLFESKNLSSPLKQLVDLDRIALK